jgi:hypothetical protein
MDHKVFRQMSHVLFANYKWAEALEIMSLRSTILFFINKTLFVS